MLRRIIAPKIGDSMGNQKLFAPNYRPTGKSVKRDYLPVLQTGIVWILLNMIFWLLIIFLILMMLSLN